MIIHCAECGDILKEGEEIEGVFRAYYHDIPSKVHFSVSNPHDYLKETICHVRCGEIENA